MFPSCCYSTLLLKGSDWLAAQKPMVVTIRKAKANWKQPLRGEEGGMSLLGVGWHQATVRRQKKGQANWFLEQTGAEHGARENEGDSAMLRGYCSHRGRPTAKNRCIIPLPTPFIRLAYPKSKRRTALVASPTQDTWRNNLEDMTWGRDFYDIIYEP